ncbi:MAG: hypothetical protein HY527_10480, partial [Betaproteobacteria bacterium]|nr:hypothetical protein [Betaproteobacteria bacterium]
MQQFAVAMLATLATDLHRKAARQPRCERRDGGFAGMMNYLILAAGLALFGVAHAGHEFPFYPSFYPQEITVEALDARAAAQRLAKGTLHVYAGGEIAVKADAGKTGSVSSLGGYVDATFDRGAPQFAERAARCAAAPS